MKSATTFLMFQGQAAEAIEQYRVWFSDLEVERLSYMPNSTQVAMAVLLLKGYRILANDSVIKHEFSFTPAISLFVECETLEEIEVYARQVAEGGKILMPLDNYGFSEKFTWVEDRFGVSWQFNYQPL